jgi:RNA polymerase sigma-70 factor (ECF subfamily)
MEVHDALPVESGATDSRDVMALYDEYLAFVWRSLRRLGVDATDLEDAAQDVFLVVHRRLGTFEKRGSIKTWIFGIAIRVAKAYRRRSARHKPELSGDGSLFACARCTPEQLSANRQAAKQVQLVLNGMNEDQRVVFVLAELEHLHAAEIATALHISANTVYSRLRLARAAFEEGLNRLLAKDDWRFR